MNAPLVFQAMNTDFLVAGLPGQEAAEVRELVEAAEMTFSRFLPESEISRLNQAGGEWVQVTALMIDLLAEAVEAYRLTGGLFNPFLGKELEELGYNRSFETLPAAKPLQTKFGTATVTGGSFVETAADFLQKPVPVELDFKLQRARLSPAAAIDVGGIAKGWIAQQAANRLLAKGIRQGLIDAGGDVVLWGREPEQGVWGVGIAHPQGLAEDVADLWLEGLTAIATSSVVKRRWQGAGAAPLHHILDPRTGISADSDLLQATVVARDLTCAEQYAKCLIVLGSEGGTAHLARNRPDLAYILVRRDGAVLSSDNLNLYAKEWKVTTHVELIAATQ